MRNIQVNSRIILLASLLILFSACGGNDNKDSASETRPGVRSEGSGTALSLPRSIVVGKANLNSGSVAGQSVAAPIQAAAATDPGTDYTTDPVEEASLADSNLAMEFINTMLCLMDEIKATSKVNQGIFIGSVPYNICSQSNRSAANADRMIDLIVNSTRADNASPHYIQIWMDDAWNLTPVKIVVEFVIYQEVNSQYPFGLFDVNYLGYVAASVDTPLANWTIDTSASIRSKALDNGLPRFEFLMNGGDGQGGNSFTAKLRSITQLTSADLQNGQSRFSFDISGDFPFQVTNNSIFNNDYNLEIDPAGNTCYSRNDLIADVWGYNLYDASSGARIPAPANPIYFDYTHIAQNDRFNTDPTTNPYQGMNYQLYYWGPGQLSGIPYSDTGSSQFSLADGTTLTDANGTNYLVKAVDIIYQALSVDVSLCSVLDATAPLNNPDLDLESLPAIELPGARLTDWPTL